MKKKLILLPLLALTLTACDLSSLMGGGNNNLGDESAEPRERSSLDPNDLAIKIADMFSVSSLWEQSARRSHRQNHQTH